MEFEPLESESELLGSELGEGLACTTIFRLEKEQSGLETLELELLELDAEVATSLNIKS